MSVIVKVMGGESLGAEVNAQIDFIERIAFACGVPLDALTAGGNKAQIELNNENLKIILGELPDKAFVFMAGKAIIIDDIYLTTEREG